VIVTGAPFALVCLVAMGGFLRWLSRSDEPVAADDPRPESDPVPPASASPAEDDD
jgi:glycine betaine transporter